MCENFVHKTFTQRNNYVEYIHRLLNISSDNFQLNEMISKANFFSIISFNDEPGNKTICSIMHFWTHKSAARQHVTHN